MARQFFKYFGLVWILGVLAWAIYYIATGTGFEPIIALPVTPIALLPGIFMMKFGARAGDKKRD